MNYADLADVKGQQLARRALARWTGDPSGLPLAPARAWCATAGWPRVTRVAAMSHKRAAKRSAIVS